MSAPRVVIVDNCVDGAESAAALFGLCGFEAHIAACGADAVRLVAELRPDVVVVEPRLPGGGWGLVARLREAAAPHPLLVVAHTTCGRAEDCDCARLAGVDRHFVKPADPRELVAALSQAADPVVVG